MSLPTQVKIVEVGPRDGLQNEKVNVPLASKVALIEGLADSGLTFIEAGSFVSPKWVPQMANSLDVMKTIKRNKNVTYAALTPNLRGLESAIEAGANEVAVFGAASESFSQKNINCSIAESLTRFEPVIDLAQQYNIPVRGYISCVLGCPYEGNIAVSDVAKVASTLLEMGCHEISLGDTIGVGTPLKTLAMLDTVLTMVPLQKVAVHFHDTYGQALANIFTALQQGVAIVDTAVSGLGGCPYAKGASGNVATEDVVYMLNGMNIQTGVDLAKLVDVGQQIMLALGRKSQSKAANALSA
jgi:hydroxymethylglutaryl-CoA lyase